MHSRCERPAHALMWCLTCHVHTRMKCKQGFQPDRIPTNNALHGLNLNHMPLTALASCSPPFSLGPNPIQTFMKKKQSLQHAECRCRKGSRASARALGSKAGDQQPSLEGKPPRQEGLLLANRMPVWKRDEGGEWRYGVSFQPAPNMPQRVAKASVKNFILQPEGSDAAMLLVRPVSQPLHASGIGPTSAVCGSSVLTCPRSRNLEQSGQGW